MGSKWVWLFLVLVLASLEGRWSEGEKCWDEERIGLLQLKSFFNSTTLSNLNFKSWVEGEENSECCEWERVVCNNITGRVIEIYLSDVRDSELGDCYINASLFSPFQQLERLDLASNKIAGCLENEGFERLSKLSNLKYLHLGGNKLNDSILSSLASLSSLKALNLCSNKLKGPINLKGLSNLEFLDLSRNILNSSTSLSLGGLSSLRILKLCEIGWKGSFDVEGLSKLEDLDLSENVLNSSTSLSLGGLSSLRILRLLNIGWKGSFDVEGLQSLSNLEKLYLGRNEIDQFVIPKGYRGLKKLYVLFLSDIITSNANALLHSILELFPSLRTLSLEHSNLNGTITRDLHNLTSSLEELILDYSKFHTSFLQTIGTCTLLKQLSMTNCEINEISHLQGPLNFKNLEHLDMYGTTLNNSFGQVIGPIASLKELKLSNCGLNSTLHDQGLCEMVYLRELYIDKNDLMGTLPPCLANLTSLQVLDISYNQITGNISSSSLMDLASIKILTISNNAFHIPISLEPFYNLSTLKEFRSENNHIYVETTSYYLTPKFQLNSITLSGDSDVATFPKFLYHQHDLHEVKLFHTTFVGEFPNWLIDNNTRLEILRLVNNSLSGPFLLPFYSSMHLKTLDISINFFHGHIPIEIGTKLPSLTYLKISRNDFSGNIPSSLGDMKSLIFLDLSHNGLSGTILDT